MQISPLAGKPAPSSLLVNVPQLVAAYYTNRPDSMQSTQRVIFGTSGHRGTSLENTFNEWHVLAITQAICDYRNSHDISGPLYLGFDTHALSAPANASALEVLAANGVETMLAEYDEYTPTPAVSLAIVQHNRGRTTRLADGIVVTPSHNPPECGGFKYNPANGGPASGEITSWIEAVANGYLHCALRGVKRLPLEAALRAPTTQRYDYLGNYVKELEQVIDIAAIRGADLRLGVDPLGGAGVHYWARIADRFGLNLEVVSTEVDPTFRFMSVDWDGRIRMDPSSPYAMARLIEFKDRYDVAFACDSDHDRHGIVTRAGGLLPSNHYLSVMIDYLFRNRPHWSRTARVGKTVVSTQMIDRITENLGRTLYEVPAGFKWFASALHMGSLGFAGEESAGASFLRQDGSTWTTDKDGIAAALLAAEITARSGRDPAANYRRLVEQYGEVSAQRVEAVATVAQKKLLAALKPEQVQCSELAGQKILQVISRAPGNDAAIGGIKVVADGCWFAARPSGTEDIYKIYAESFHGADHVARIVSEAQAIVDAALETAKPKTADIS